MTSFVHKNQDKKGIMVNRKKSSKWQIQQERCRLTHPEPPKGVHNPVPLENLVSNLMKKIGMGDLHWLNVLESEWADLVGDAVSKHTRPGIVKGGDLTVFVDSSVWMSELSRHGKGKIMDNLKKRFGKSKIRTIGFRLDPDA